MTSWLRLQERSCFLSLLVWGGCWLEATRKLLVLFVPIDQYWNNLQGWLFAFDKEGSGRAWLALLDYIWVSASSHFEIECLLLVTIQLPLNSLMTLRLWHRFRALVLNVCRHWFRDIGFLELKTAWRWIRTCFIYFQTSSSRWGLLCIIGSQQDSGSSLLVILVLNLKIIANEIGRFSLPWSTLLTISRCRVVSL